MSVRPERPEHAVELLGRLGPQVLQDALARLDSLRPPPGGLRNGCKHVIGGSERTERCPCTACGRVGRRGCEAIHRKLSERGLAAGRQRRSTKRQICVRQRGKFGKIDATRIGRHPVLEHVRRYGPSYSVGARPPKEEAEAATDWSLD